MNRRFGDAGVRRQLREPKAVAVAAISYLMEYAEDAPSTIPYGDFPTEYLETGFQFDISPANVSSFTQYLKRFTGSNWLRLQTASQIRLRTAAGIYNMTPSAPLVVSGSYTLRCEWGVSLTLTGDATGSVSLAGSGHWGSLGTTNVEVGRESVGTNAFVYGTLGRPRAL